MTIDSFTGAHAFLSNFYYCGSPISFEGINYPTVEHAYQAAKSLDPMVRNEFTDSALTPGQAKRLGKVIPLRGNWDSEKLLVMNQLLKKKFHLFSVPADMLELTDDNLLIEGNNWNDIYWGKCNGMGHNYLGRLLMKIRTDNRRFYGRPELVRIAPSCPDHVEQIGIF